MRSSTIARPAFGLAAGSALALAAIAGSAYAAPEPTRIDDRPLSPERFPKVQEYILETPDAVRSFAAHPHKNNRLTKLLISNQVVIRGDGTSAYAAFNQIKGRYPEITFDGNVGSLDDVWVVTTPNARSAMHVARALRSTGIVEDAFADHGEVPNHDFLESRQREIVGTMIRRLKQTSAPGILTDGDRGSLGDVAPQGVADPDLGFQWHLINALNPGFDNNITQAIYDTMGYDGSGITVGVVRTLSGVSDVTNEHTDRSHPDLMGSFNDPLTDEIDLAIEPPSRYLTAMAGTISADRDNGFNGHGIAPGSDFAELSQGTGLNFANMLEKAPDDIQIKVIPMGSQFSFTNDQFNEGNRNDFVYDSFINQLQAGRNGKGTIFVFGGGFSINFINASVPGTNINLADPDPMASGEMGENPKLMTGARPILLYPDPYDGLGVPEIIADADSDSVIDGNVINTTVIDDPVLPNNSWRYGPTYIMAQSNYYNLASKWNTFLINAVAEDGSADMSQAIGPSVFASVYTGTSNPISYFDNGGALPRGHVTTVPFGTETSLLPLNAGSDEYPNPLVPTLPDALDLPSVNNNSAAVGAGIIALMLDANPNLTIRDVQHILFESIYDSTRPTSVQFPNFNPMINYYSPFNGTGGSFWQLANADFLTSGGTLVNIRHSDQYGFGVIDAELAVSKAATWTKVPQLIVLDSGDVTQDSEGDGQMRVPREIPNAEFVELSDTLYQVAQSATSPEIVLCIRPNIKIESIVLELTIDGEGGSNDLHIEVESPSRTISNMIYPTTTNASGTTYDNVEDSEADANAFQAFDGESAFINHEFTSYKHWGELSGGQWILRFTDFGPDEEHTEGEADDPDTPENETMVVTHDLGVWGVPGSEVRGQHNVTSFRFRIFGTQTGADPFLGCDPFATSCPSDINGDGIVTRADLLLFLTWVQTGDARADINGDGFVNFADISTYVAIFTPGFCNDGSSVIPLVGNRPLTPNPGGDRGGVVVPF